MCAYVSEHQARERLNHGCSSYGEGGGAMESLLRGRKWHGSQQVQARVHNRWCKSKQKRCMKEREGKLRVRMAFQG